MLHLKLSPISPRKERSFVKVLVELEVGHLMFSFWHFFFKCPKAPEKSLNFLLAIPCTCSDLLTWSSNFSGILRYRVDFQSMELDDDYGNGFIDSDDDD